MRKVGFLCILLLLSGCLAPVSELAHEIRETRPRMDAMTREIQDLRHVITIMFETATSGKFAVKYDEKRGTIAVVPREK